MVTNDTHATVTEEPAKGESLVRNIIAGHPQGAVRRQVLYLATVLATLAATDQSVLGFVGLAVALSCLFLLASTDALA